ncbi:MAG: transposase [Kiritimatiellia bacterium]|jgi:putative transposase
MRLPRVLAKGEGIYHVISRISGQRFLLDENEKKRLEWLMNAAAGFSGVDILAYVFMDNHFHILVKVPVPQPVDDQELVRRMRLLYGKKKTDRILAEWDLWEKKGMAGRVVDAKFALRRRMYDLSQFCKTFKETFSMMYNDRHDHSGTIWGSRFKSILLSPDYSTIMTVAAYINLNPVRADIVGEPGAYPWSGYGAAKQGKGLARKAMCNLVGTALGRKEAVSFEVALAACDAAMEGYVDAPASGEAIVAPVAKYDPDSESDFDAAKVDAAIKEGKPLTLFEAIRCKVRYFSYGVAVGPATFVIEIVKRLTRSKDTKRKCAGCDDLELYTARPLRGGGELSVPKSHIA